MQISINLSYDTEFHLHQKKKKIIFISLACTVPCFETEAWGNSEMA